jgi:hypothetical protein
MVWPPSRLLINKLRRTVACNCTYHGDPIAPLASLSHARNAGSTANGWSGWEWFKTSLPIPTTAEEVAHCMDRIRQFSSLANCSQRIVIGIWATSRTETLKRKCPIGEVPGPGRARSGRTALHEGEGEQESPRRRALQENYRN